MTLEDLRKKVIYQNTIDTWIVFCEEGKINAYDPENYKKFITYLTKTGLSMKKFPFCVMESENPDEIEKARIKFSEELSESKDPETDAYTIKLTDSTMELIRNFEL